MLAEHDRVFCVKYPSLENSFIKMAIFKTSYLGEYLIWGKWSSFKETFKVSVPQGYRDSPGIWLLKL